MKINKEDKKIQELLMNIFVLPEIPLIRQGDDLGKIICEFAANLKIVIMF